MLVVLKVVNNYDFNSSAQSLDLIFNLFYLYTCKFIFKKNRFNIFKLYTHQENKKRSNQRYNAYFLDPIMLCIFYLKILS